MKSGALRSETTRVFTGDTLMRSILTMVVLVGSSIGHVGADVCDDVEAVYAASTTDFENWKGRARHGGNRWTSTFRLANAYNCDISQYRWGSSFVCEWSFDDREEASAALGALVSNMSRCVVDRRAPGTSRWSDDGKQNVTLKWNTPDDFEVSVREDEYERRDGVVRPFVVAKFGR